MYNLLYLIFKNRQEPPTKVGGMSKQQPKDKVVLDMSETQSVSEHAPESSILDRPEDPLLKNGGFSAPKI